MKKVMVGSPICQDYEILKEFLVSLDELLKEDIEISYCFVDDNKEEESSKLLLDYKSKKKNVEILKIDLGELNSSIYHCDENTHMWSNKLIDKVIAFKNRIIEKFLDSDNDYLFFIDSDIVLDKRTLINLIEADKDIIANIFWTKWSVNSREEPQVWMKDFYTFYEEESDPGGVKTTAFINMLRTPGVYRVGGLGACTLIKRRPLECGVNFSKIRNISFWGEDRAFCIRAEVLGFDLYVDTRQPALHIYRKTDLGRVDEFKNQCEKNYILSLSDKPFKAVELIENYDYRKQLNDEWKNLFFDKEIIRLKELLKKREQQIFLNNEIKKVTIKNIRGNFENKNIFNVKLKVEANGYCNWKSEEEGYYINISMKKDLDNTWKILSYDKEKDYNFKSVSIIRNISLDNKLTLSMIVKNEENRYLERVLKEHKKYIDSAVIIDDGSTDRTVDIVKDILGDCNLVLIENKESIFENEYKLRKMQWDETIKTNPQWILSLDADEIFEKSFASGVKDLVNSNLDVDGYSFRLYDFWNEDSYREDQYWYAHKFFRMFLIRYQENFNYIWKETNQHCGRIPYNCYDLNNALSNYRLKHLGWAREEDRLAKFKRYMELDPKGELGNIKQYNSILDENPNLVKWIE